MSYHRTSSPGSRRLAHPARLSDGSYPPTTSTVYASPRTSGERIVPISTTTFVTRDAYSGRPRRSTLTDPSRPTTNLQTTSLLPPHPRSRPAVIQSSHDRPHSPSSPHAYATRTPDYYAVPATSSHRDHSHKKLYTIDGGGKSRLVADIDINTSHGTSHRRHSLDRNSDRHSSSHHRHKAYHLSGPSTRKTEPEAFSYTDPAAMYRDTEPRWRHRAGSVEASRPRPSSALIEPYPPRSSPREPGPPTSRALDKFNDNAGRLNGAREIPRSSNRLSYQEPQYNLDGYNSSSGRHSTAVHQDRARDAYSRDAERARPIQRYEDRSVEQRGFGIRSGSQDRYNHNMNKGSSESFDAYYSDRDRDHAPPRSDPRAYDHPRDSDREREYRPRDRDRLRDDGYTSERDRYSDRDRDRKSRDRPRDRDRDVTPRDSGDSLANTILPAAATAAIGSLGAMAAAAYGSDSNSKARDREYDDRDRERERERDRDRERNQQEREQEHERKQRDRERERREREKERERNAERDSEKERDGLYERETRPRERPRERESDRTRHSSSSESGQDRHRSSRRHRTPGRDTSPPQDKDSRFAADDRQRGYESGQMYQPDERQHVPERDRPAPVDPPAELDPDEEYRRRMEQAQRDLSSHDAPDPGRERRPNGGDSGPSKMPPPSAADYPESTTRENRVRIVEPPSDREDAQPIKGILKRPTQRFPEDPNPAREGVAPLKEAAKEGIPPGARWTKIDRRLVNPQALEEAQERFEERLDCVIVLRVLTKDEIQKLADKTLKIREARSYDDEDRERHERRERRRRDRHDRDEYEDEDSEDEYAPRAPRMLEAPDDGQQEPTADFVRDRDRRREREREPAYASGAL